MNELKKALDDVAGDLSVSEQRVKDAVLGTKRKKSMQSVPILVTLCLMIGIVSLLVMQKPIQNSSTVVSEELYTYALYSNLLNTGIEGEFSDNDKYNAYEKMVAYLAVPDYGLSKSLKIEEDDVEVYTQKLYDYIELSQENKAVFVKRLQDGGMTFEQYKNSILPILGRYGAMNNLLRKQLEEKYLYIEMFSDGMVREDAIAYYEEHYAQELQAFREKHHITQQHNSIIGTVGTVALVENNMFFFIGNRVVSNITDYTREQVLEKYQAKLNGVWIPNVTDEPLKPGDIIKVKTNGRITGESTDYYSIGNNGGLELLAPAGQSSEVIERHIAAKKQAQWVNFFNMLQWDFADDLSAFIMELPTYVVHVGELSYTISISDTSNRIRVVANDEPKYLRLSPTESKQLRELLQSP